MAGSKIAAFFLFLGLAMVVQARDHHHGHQVLNYVEGYVYAQDCYGKWVKHLEHALVGITCGKVYKQAYTDSNGYFQIPTGALKPEHCWGYAISSDDATYKVPVRHGLKTKVEYSSTYHHIKFYTTGPFAFAPKWCPKY